MPIAYNICKKHQTIVSPKQSHCKTGQNAANGTYVLRVVTSSSGNQGRHRQANIRGARQLKNHGFAWRTNQWLFSSVLPSTSLSPSWTLEGLFELTRRPLIHGPQIAACLASGTTEKQRHHQVCRDRSQDRDKNNWWKPRLCVCWKRNCFCCSKNYDAQAPLGPLRSIPPGGNFAKSHIFNQILWPSCHIIKFY